MDRNPAEFLNSSLILWILARISGGVESPAKSVVSHKQRLQNIYKTLVKYRGHSVIDVLP
jgi:hypothetical protein